MRVAVIGATGAVGQELVRLLEGSALPIRELVLIASPRSAGKVMRFAGSDIEVRALDERGFDGVDLAFFSAGGDRSRQWAPLAAAAGALVIDNSSAFRMEPDVPLVIPEVNGLGTPGDMLATRPSRGILANPNCTTAVLLTAIAPIHRAVGIQAIIAASYQAVSGSGQAGIAELDAQVRAAVAGTPVTDPGPGSVYPHPIAFNVLPQVDRFLDAPPPQAGPGADQQQPSLVGYTREEIKLRNEARKILAAPALRVTCTCVRVPVYRSHSIAASLLLGAPLTPDAARDHIAAAAGVQVLDAPAQSLYPTALHAAGQHDVFVGRIREDLVLAPGLCIWAAGDQLLKGAALNALQIAEQAHAAGWLTSTPPPPS